MSLDLNKDIIEEIRARSDIADVISSCGVQLKRSGSSNFKGLCPFHQEKTPSFHVDTARQAFHCFGCGKGGDVFRFFMDKENVDFINAAQILASRCGVIIPEKSDNYHQNRSRPGEKERLIAINTEFSKFFCRCLAESPASPAAAYLAGRNITRDVIQKFKIGVAPDEWTACLNYGRGLGFSDAEMLTAGIIRKKEDTGRVYDQFKGRITFTIENELGNPVGFSARTLEAKPLDGRKYVNTPDTPVFHKGRLLYALPQARQGIGKAKKAVLCEGQLDAIAFHRAGFDFAVAPLGTAFTPEQARMIRRYSSNLILAFDSDGAGRKAVLRAAEILLPLSVDLRVLQIPGGKDPDELYAAGGADALAEALNASLPWLEILRLTLPEKFDMATPVGRSQAASFIASYLKHIVNEVELELYIAEAAKMLGVSENAVKSVLNNTAAPPAYRPAPAPQPAPAAAGQSKKSAVDPAHTALFTLLELALASIDHGRKIAEKLGDEVPDNADPVAAALNIAINAALNDEYDTIPSALQDLLIETPSPEVSRALIKPTVFCNPDRAINEACTELRRIRRESGKNELLSRLRTEQDPLKRLELLTKLQQITSNMEATE